jgi:ElaB/YqjD/DUF883 family membrane-anchored ribosome-binding protein
MTLNDSSSALRDAVTQTGDVEQIKAGIERTQADLADTVAELQRKLTVSHLLEETKRTARETLNSWGESAMAATAVGVSQAQQFVEVTRERVRRNPTPAVLVGAGVAAALWHNARRRRRRQA